MKMVQDIRVRIQRILRVSFFFFGKFPEEAKTDASFGTYPIGTHYFSKTHLTLQQIPRIE